MTIAPPLALTLGVLQLQFELLECQSYATAWRALASCYIKTLILVKT